MARLRQERPYYDRGGHILTEVAILWPGWPYYYDWGCHIMTKWPYCDRGGHITTGWPYYDGVTILWPRWPYYDRSGHIMTELEILWPGWSYYDWVGNIMTGVVILQLCRIFLIEFEDLKLAVSATVNTVCPVLQTEIILRNSKNTRLNSILYSK